MDRTRDRGGESEKMIEGASCDWRWERGLHCRIAFIVILYKRI